MKLVILDCRLSEQSVDPDHSGVICGNLSGSMQINAAKRIVYIPEDTLSICRTGYIPAHHHRQTRVCEAMRYNCGECFGHCILQFEICL